MAKVKKGRGVTSVRNPRGVAVKGAPRKGVAKKAVVKKAVVKKAVVKKAVVKKAVAKKAARKKVLEPIARFAIKELDPIAKCGPDTSVQFLYRVDEMVEGRRTPHLVFFDHHGWYCEHGRTCPAVAPARKHNGHIARAS